MTRCVVTSKSCYPRGWNRTLQPGRTTRLFLSRLCLFLCVWTPKELRKRLGIFLLASCFSDFHEDPLVDEYVWTSRMQFCRILALFIVIPVHGCRGLATERSMKYPRAPRCGRRSPTCSARCSFRCLDGPKTIDGNLVFMSSWMMFFLDIRDIQRKVEHPGFPHETSRDDKDSLYFSSVSRPMSHAHMIIRWITKFFKSWMLHEYVNRDLDSRVKTSETDQEIPIWLGVFAVYNFLYQMLLVQLNFSANTVGLWGLYKSFFFLFNNLHRILGNQ